ncbi:gas vesicle protein GvpO [Streptomyces blattellae]|uniref:gas vesicle protein GvpO n=1 Tax=Streptomyces blattellae TaxID=2569855 RepID=UPI0012B6E75A|nr:gas vesicle protein [Streptomyces blattellae]
MITNGNDRPARVSAAEAMRQATEQLTELLGRVPESVSSLKPTDEGWEAEVEVVEVERIPETTSVMASYEVVLDPGGHLLAYERGRRYTRSQVDRENR